MKSAIVQSRSKLMSFDYTITNLKFPSMTESEHGYRMVSTDKGGEKGIVLRLERIRGSQKWQSTIQEISKHGPPGLPSQAVFAALKRALANASNNADIEEDGNQPFVDLEPLSDELVMHLYIPIVGFPIEYKFIFSQVNREQIDIVESYLHEAQEDIVTLTKKVDVLTNLLKESRKPNFSLFRSNSATSNGQLVDWTLESANFLDCKWAEGNSKKLLIIPRNGWYRISIRLSSQDGSASRSMVLIINGNPSLETHNGANTGYNATLQVTDCLKLDAGSQMGVRHTSNYNSLADPNGNCLFLEFVGDD